MNWMSNFEQFVSQLSDLQRQAFNNWTSSMSQMQNLKMPNPRENFDNFLNLQEQAITNSLEFQALLTRFSIETQKQFWQSYFNRLRSK